MSLFSITKHYYDFASGDGALLGIIYDITIKVFGYKHRYASLYLKQKDGSYRLWQTTKRRQFAFTSGKIQMELPGLSLTLQYKKKAGTMPEFLAEEKLNWRADPWLEYTGTIRAGDEIYKLGAAGYCDHVVIRGLPRALKLKELVWGRVATKDGWGTFLFLRRKGGTISLVACGKDGPPAVSGVCSINCDGEVLGEPGGAEVKLARQFDINNELVVAGRLTGFVVRKLYEFISGNPFENKRFGTIDIKNGDTVLSGTGIYEYVTWPD